MSKHTPGPWTLTRTGDQKRWIVGDRQSAWGTEVAEVYSDDTDPDEASANAHLIAAAPSLLEALKELGVAIAVQSNLRDDFPKVFEKFVLSLKAIAKAEGR